MVIALFGQFNEEWLRTFLALPNRIPSHDTLGLATIPRQPGSINQ